MTKASEMVGVRAEMTAVRTVDLRAESLAELKVELKAALKAGMLETWKADWLASRLVILSVALLERLLDYSTVSWKVLLLAAQ